MRLFQDSYFSDLTLGCRTVIKNTCTYDSKLIIFTCVLDNCMTCVCVCHYDNLKTRTV